MTAISYSTPLAALSGVVLDTETTGLDARTARIVEIGAIRVEGERIIEAERFHARLDPGVPIPAATTKVHGITDADVRGAPRFASVAEKLVTFIGPGIVIGHTIGYDMTVLAREAERAGVGWRPPRALDVRTLAELALPTLAQYDLDRLCELLVIPIEGRHSAVGDAVATARIFAALVPLLRQRGIRTLAEAETATRSLADRQASAARASVYDSAPPTDAAPTLSRIDSFPYRHRVRDLMSAPAAWCDDGASVGQALHVLIERRISSVLVRCEGGVIGIATERDLIRAIDKRGAAGLETPVAEVASRPLQAVPAESFVYRAIGRIERLGMRHLGVADEKGDIVGIVTTRNLLRHRATTAILLGDEIDCAASVADLGRAFAKLPLMARSLMAEEVDPRLIAEVVSAEIAAITRRAAEMAEARMREAGAVGPPVPYAVVVLGSAGRGESLLAADQDNAIVYAKGAPDGPEDIWFAMLAGYMNEILDAVGIPLCKGGVMARNAAWRLDEAGWKRKIEGWVRRQSGEDLLNVDIFFDGIAVHGDTGLGERVIAHAFDVAGRAPDFLLQLSELARRWRAPLGLLGGIKAEDDGRTDLKKGGLLPVFTAARVLAIRHGLRARGTPARLRAYAELGKASSEDIEAVIDAHGVVLGAMMAQQLADAEAGVRLSPRVDVKRFTADERARLKEALSNVAIAGALVGEGRL